MSDVRRRELRALVAHARANGPSQAQIARAAGVSQPLVSQAATGKLVAETDRVKRLFEYLREATPPAPVHPGQPMEDIDPHLRDALTRLSDGSPEGDMRLVRLLDAIVGIRLRPDTV